MIVEQRFCQLMAIETTHESGKEGTILGNIEPFYD
jgi:hypothetical protein